ncbi:hypothetical protein BACCOP_03832 [Phocaeicola coprocola DSM 17136]|uniref:Uncharacterized protein n=1 Tax=Phocaeicola coprocola DSM 17136 TaxID=470145 RepID=B3JPN1_9BACT|nr:hypothetical protein BACCOP_03832 [Phocaeicola coprocola DSM 17136]
MIIPFVIHLYIFFLSFLFQTRAKSFFTLVIQSVKLEKKKEKNG